MDHQKAWLPTIYHYLTFLFVLFIHKSSSKGRTISEESSTDFCELLLCGSRGVGGVATMSDELIRVDVFDLEEEDDDEEEDSYAD